MIENRQISVVVQGPIAANHDRPQSEGVTRRSLEAIRCHLPGAHIILSTWKGSDTGGLDFDELVLSDDPGSSVIMYYKDGRPHRVNVNRQIVSTMAGLQRVKTDYAMKLRADNVLHGDSCKTLFEVFPERAEKHRYLNDRIVIANLCAQAYSQGLPLPFFLCDFFYFGRTEDLRTFWGQPLVRDYVYREELKGKRQHPQYPWPQTVVEQMLFVAFLNKFAPVELTSKFGDTGLRDLSRQVVANNFIVCDREMLGLEVPERLAQRDGFPYTYYSHVLWQWLYRRYCAPGFEPERGRSWRVPYLATRAMMYLRYGLKQHGRLLRCQLRTRRD